MAAREAHIAGIGRLKENGNFVSGGAIMDDDGRMIGSMVVYSFPDRAALDACIAADPYSKGDVWRDVTVHPFRAVR